MPTIQDLVRAIAHREGVEAVVILGRDGLLIDGSVSGPFDREHLAAVTPMIASAAESLGQAAARGPLVTSILEYEHGAAVVSCISSEALLVVLVRSTSDIGSLLYDLRRHRTHIASLA